MEPRAAPMQPPSDRPAALRGIRLGRLLGFPVYLSPSWLVLAVVVTLAYGQLVARTRPELGAVASYGVGLAFVALLVASVLLHELGHALASRHFGVGVRGITLELLGGHTEVDSESPRPVVELVVALAGPAVSLLVGLGAAASSAVLPGGTLVRQMAVQVAIANGIVALFNALPGLPLDGGRALVALVWAGSGDVHLGRRVAGWAGRGLAVGCAVAAVALFSAGWLSVLGLAFIVLVAGTVWFGAGAAVRLGRAGSRLHLVDLERLAHPIFPVPTGMPLAEALRRAAEAGVPDAVITVVDRDGVATGLVHGEAAAAVPAERRPWIAVETLARRIDPARAIPVGTRGADVVRAVQGDPAGEYLVTSGQDVIGVLRVADLLRVLGARR